jgi:hypothetical protein
MNRLRATWCEAAYQQEWNITGIQVQVPADRLQAGELAGEEVLSQHTRVQVHHLQLVLYISKLKSALKKNQTQSNTGSISVVAPD